jgi:hypothetical protein
LEGKSDNTLGKELEPISGGLPGSARGEGRTRVLGCSASAFAGDREPPGAPQWGGGGGSPLRRVLCQGQALRSRDKRGSSEGLRRRTTRKNLPMWGFVGCQEHFLGDLGPAVAEMSMRTLESASEKLGGETRETGSYTGQGKAKDKAGYF